MSKENSPAYGPSAAQPGMPTRNIMREDFGWEVPVETVPLPTRGIIYPGTSFFAGKETIDIRAMTAREEDILTSRAFLKKGTVVNELIKSCMSDRGADPNDLIAGDRNALMVAIRITGYGSEYRVEATCPKCGHNGPQTFDLGNLGIKRLEVEPVMPGENLFAFDLPVTKKRIHFKLLSGRDQDEISTQVSKMKTLMPDAADTSVTSYLDRAIVRVGDITDKTKISMFVRNMPAQDSRMLRKHIRNIEPGVDMSNDIECSSCGEASRVDMPLGSSFFWPDA